MIELGCLHPKIQSPCMWAFQGGAHSLRDPRGGDVHDLWRLQQLGYDVYRLRCVVCTHNTQCPHAAAPERPLRFHA